MEVKAGYKQTECGVIPEGWKVSPLIDLCIKIQDGTHFSPKIGGSDYLYITSKNVRFGFLDISNADTIDKVQHGHIYRRCDVRVGDLLLTKDGANTGNAAMNIIEEEFSLLSSVAFLRFDKKNDPYYFLQQILSYPGQFRIKEAMSGNAITRLTLQKIRKLYYPVPPTKVEQTAIANALSDADDLIRSLEKLIAKKRNIKQGATQKLLHPKEGWIEKRLGDFLDYEQPTDYLVTDTEYDDNNQTPVLTAGKTFILGYTNEEHGIFKNLPVIIFDDFTTAIKFVDFPFKAKSSAMKMLIPKNDKVNLRFIYEIMLQIKYPLGDHKRHWIGEFQHLEITVPNSPEEQTSIANIFSDMDAEIAALEIKLEKYRMIKLGMMQNLLTGKIRLV